MGVYTGYQARRSTQEQHSPLHIASSQARMGSAIIILENYNYFCNISFPCSLLYEKNVVNFLNAGRSFTPEVFILCT